MPKKREKIQHDFISEPVKYLDLNCFSCIEAE